MYRLLTVKQIRELERAIFTEQGLEAKELTRNAGIALADTAEAEYNMIRSASITRIAEARMKGPLGMGVKVPPTTLRVAIFAGPGNNGADGWSAATELQRRHISVHVFSTENPLELEGTIEDMAQEAIRKGVTWSQLSPHASSGEIASSLSGTTIVIDALLGISMRLPLEGVIARACEAINAVPVPVISADIPTGINPDTGEPDEFAVRASKTVTFLAAKRGLVELPAPLYTGSVSVAPLGLDPAFLDRFSDVPEMLTNHELAHLIPFPKLLDNKYTRGAVLIVGGSRRYVGAAILAANAAARSGAGYVQLALPESLVGLAQSHLLTVPVIGLPETSKGTISLHALDLVNELAASSNAIVLGPGMDRDDDTDSFIRTLVRIAPCTVVLDADGINAYKNHAVELIDSPSSLVITPHIGEAARLLEKTSEDVAAHQVEIAKHLSGNYRTVVLKGPNTVVACSKRTSIDINGSPVLATAGTGDVLAGIIGAFVAQGLDPYDAATAGVRLHANAGVIAGETLTPMCVTATDVIDALPPAVQALLAER